MAAEFEGLVELVVEAIALTGVYGAYIDPRTTVRVMPLPFVRVDLCEKLTPTRTPCGRPDNSHRCCQRATEAGAH